MHRVVLLLGSNIDKERNLPAAVRLLTEAVAVVSVSPVYETGPVGLESQPNFFNAATIIQTDESAVELKDGLIREIEFKLHRTRTADRNAPRTIDLDIVLYDDAVFDYTPADGRTRHIPEPELSRFVHCALPVADLLPTMSHPETGEPLRRIADRLLRESDAERGKTIWPRPDIDLRRLLRGAPPTV
jgi:2-amino-4-hydroxy-6-hydroxymethyldihydropteridine diphosphokinase